MKYRMKAKFEKEREEPRNCNPLPSSNSIFEVTLRLDRPHVDMNAATSTCRKRDLTGLPCCHVIGCSTWLKQDVEDLLHPFFKKKKYTQVYQGAILPCQG